MLEVHIYLETVDRADVLERWELVVGDVNYSLMSHLHLTQEDARLHLINAFNSMQVKNGYGFSSPSPNKVWSDDF